VFFSFYKIFHYGQQAHNVCSYINKSIVESQSEKPKKVIKIAKILLTFKRKLNSFGKFTKKQGGEGKKTLRPVFIKS